MIKTRTQILEEARKILARKREILGKDSNDQEFFKHHVKKLERIESHKMEIGIETYERGNELLPIIVRRMAQKIVVDNPKLKDIDISKFELTDIASLYGKTRISQSTIDNINRRTKLKDNVDMEDLMSLSTDELAMFKDSISEHRRHTLINQSEHSDVISFCHTLNAVINNHNSKDTIFQFIEPIEILIDLNKISKKKERESSGGVILPPLIIRKDRSVSRESSTPSSVISMDETYVSSYSSDSSGSFRSSKTRSVYFSEVLVSSTPTPPPLPAGRNRSFRAQKSIL